MPHLDKVVHFGLFFLLVILGHLAYGRYRSGMSRVTAFRWVVLYAAYAALDECLQPLVGRTASFIDWLADVAGILAATMLVTTRRLDARR